MSVDCNPNKSVHGCASFIFAIAPASKRIQGEVRLSGVRQIIPTLDFSSRSEISVDQRPPFSMPADIQGSAAWIILRNQPCNPSATTLDCSPDQLINTCIWNSLH